MNKKIDKDLEKVDLYFKNVFYTVFEDIKGQVKDIKDKETREAIEKKVFNNYLDVYFDYLKKVYYKY